MRCAGCGDAMVRWTAGCASTPSASSSIICSASLTKHGTTFSELPSWLSWPRRMAVLGRVSGLVQTLRLNHGCRSPSENCPGTRVRVAIGDKALGLGSGDGCLLRKLHPSILSAEPLNAVTLRGVPNFRVVNCTEYVAVCGYCT